LTPTPPILTVLFYSAAAAGLSVAGVLPVLRRDRLPLRWMGWANALAGGVMIGAAYALTVHVDEALELGAGALLGILFIHWSHMGIGTEELDLNSVEQMEPAYGYRVMLMTVLHSGWEGVAIGTAAVVDLSFGIFLALALAVHNVPEATVLAAVLRGQGVRGRSVAALTVAVNVPQVLLAVSVYGVVSAAPATLPWVAGFAVGALIDLVLVELLAQSYRQAGKISIAVVAAVSMGIVVLVEGLLG